MLAPRKTLWSTPPSALDHIEQWIDLQPNDCVCDIGCGDGRILLQWAERYTCRLRKQQEEQQQGKEDINMNTSPPPLTTTTETIATTTITPPPPIISFIGIDIDPNRIQQSQIALQNSIQNGTIDTLYVSIIFHCGNALDVKSKQLYQNANIFFLYLIPRGLKLIKPILLDIHQNKNNLKKMIQQEVANTTTNKNKNTKMYLDDKQSIQKRNVNKNKNENENENDMTEVTVRVEKKNEDHPTSTNNNPILRIITYMAKLPGENQVDRALCKVEHQPGAEWPLYLYHL